MNTFSQSIIIGIKGAVLALDGQTGAELWRRDLKGSEFVNVVLAGEQILAATRGEVFSLQKSTGRVLWHNPLTGLGRGLVSMACEGSSGQSPVLAEKVHRDQQAAAAASAAASST